MSDHPSSSIASVPIHSKPQLYVQNQREVRKSRSVHVITSSSLRPRFLPQSRAEYIRQREAMRIICPQMNILPDEPFQQQSDRVGAPLSVISEEESSPESDGPISTSLPEKQSSESHSPSTSRNTHSLLNSACIHGSMENLHRPRNYRTAQPDRPDYISSDEVLVLNASGPPTISISSDSYQSIDSDSDNTATISDDDESVQNSSLGSTTTSISMSISASPSTSQEESSLALLRRPVQHFLFAGLTSQRSKIQTGDASLADYNLREASRYILNSLLLNSWRSGREEIKKIAIENAQLKMQENNLGLQLRVVRHLQSTEKDRALENTQESLGLKNQLSGLQKSVKRNEYELKSTEEDLRTTKQMYNNLMETKAEFKRRTAEALEHKVSLMRVLEIEKQREVQNSEVNFKLGNQMTELETKIKDLTRQTNQWKDRTGEYEILGWNMKRRIDSQQTEVDELKRDYEIQHRKMMHMALERRDCEDIVEQIEDQMEFSLREHDSIQDELNMTAEECQNVENDVQEMEEIGRQLRIENNDIRKELKLYELQNLRRHRSIVRIIYTWKYVIQFFLFGPESTLDSMMTDGCFRTKTK